MCIILWLDELRQLATLVKHAQSLAAYLPSASSEHFAAFRAGQYSYCAFQLKLGRSIHAIPHSLIQLWAEALSEHLCYSAIASVFAGALFRSPFMYTALPEHILAAFRQLRLHGLW